MVEADRPHDRFDAVGDLAGDRHIALLLPGAACGMLASAHRMIVVPRMIVPARFRKISTRVSSPISDVLERRPLIFGKLHHETAAAALQDAAAEDESSQQRTGDAGHVKAEHHHALQANAPGQPRVRDESGDDQRVDRQPAEQVISGGQDGRQPVHFPRIATREKHPSEPEPGAPNAHPADDPGCSTHPCGHRLLGLGDFMCRGALAILCTMSAVQAGAPYPISFAAGFCTLACSAGFCAALVAILNVTGTVTPITEKPQPNYAAWKLAGKLRVSDASRLWCNIEPGCAASPGFPGVGAGDAQRDQSRGTARRQSAGRKPGCDRSGTKQPELGHRDRSAHAKSMGAFARTLATDS